jgi:protocatechuate 3,4-dioxygenase beta subunit
MDGRQDALRQGENPPGEHAITADFAARLAGLAPTRLGETVGALVTALQRLAAERGLSPAELRAAVSFLTEVGHHADARRQEWVLLADVLGLSSLVEDLAHPRPAGATPNTVAGPFYRADAPDLPPGASISRDGKGVPLAVRGRVTGLSGGALSGALVEVWQANGEGKYENQEPDRQPENNLRGRFRTDGLGRFWFRSVMPKGYALPADGPVGRLMAALGLSADRPAHVHFRVSAEGHERLTTHIFDRADPAIGRDAIFGVKPELLAEFPPAEGGAEGRTLDLTFVLCPRRQG